jgi:hypothetical protein
VISSWAWKGHLMNLKIEVDWALRFILEGLEKLGPVHKPICIGRNKRGKKWAPKCKPWPKLISKPILGSEVELGFLSSMGAGHEGPSSPNTNSALLDTLPKEGGLDVCVW